MNGKPIYSTVAEAAGGNFTLQESETILSAEQALLSVEIGPSMIIGAGQGLFAKKDFEEGEVIIPRYWGRLAVGKLSSPSDSFFQDHNAFGLRDRVLEYQTQPLPPASLCKVFIVGSLSCVGSYINSVYYVDNFDTEHDAFGLLAEKKVDILSNSMLAHNCVIEEVKSSITPSVKVNGFSTFSDWARWSEQSGIQITALKSIKSGEELFFLDYRPLTSATWEDDEMEETESTSDEEYMPTTNKSTVSENEPKVNV